MSLPNHIEKEKHRILELARRILELYRHYPRITEEGERIKTAREMAEKAHEISLIARQEERDESLIAKQIDDLLEVFHNQEVAGLKESIRHLLFKNERTLDEDIIVLSETVRNVCITHVKSNIRGAMQPNPAEYMEKIIHLVQAE